MIFVSALAIALVAQTPSVDAKAESRVALAKYADCIVVKKGDAVRAMLAQPYDDRVSKESRILNDEGCPVSTPVMTFEQSLVRNLDGLVLRSVLYQALIRREPTRIRASAPIPAQIAFPIGRTWPGSPAASYLSFIARGRCLIERDGENARRLALAPINSPTETEAMRALAKTFGKCNWRGDERLAARGALAEIYYRAAEPAGVQ